MGASRPGRMHRRFAVALILAVVAGSPASAEASPSPRWIKPDAEEHVAAGLAAGLGAAAVVAIACDRCADGATIVPVAVAAALVAGAAKEAADYLGLGTPELRDLMNTAIGGILGAGMASLALQGASGATTGPASMGSALLEAAAVTATVVVARVALRRRPRQPTEKATPPQ